ncbi:MAG: GNAT family N-acetyltransferase [Bacteroidia bacterium]
MKTEHIIKRATLDDLNSLAELFDSYRNFYKKESAIEEAKQFLKERITNNESVIFVSFNQQNIMTGFVQLYPLFSSTRMKRLWLLNDLFVRADYRGLRISVALINKAKHLCYETNACGLTLETAKTNDIGNQLYPLMEFILDEDHNFYYWDIKLNADLSPALSLPTDSLTL